MTISTRWRLRRGLDVITYEFENIPADALDVLSARPARPGDRARWR
jgi:phosphoribosylaminoimidazole carboxylase (NCAIR synthetase)